MNEINEIDRLVHFDLKGAAPKIDYLLKVISTISTWGATGIVLEYEDAFPFQGKLSNLCGPNSYSNSDIESILKVCSTLQLKVIPLIQCLGHLEFLLKHDQFKKFREMPLYPNAICPNHPESLQLIKLMISQVIDAHPNTKYIHIGADEVWHIGKCESCLNILEKGKNNGDLYLSWIRNITQWIKSLWPDKRIIAWDDMIRDIPVSKLKEYNIGDLFEPMIWKYESTDFKLPSGMFERYNEVFTNVWGASAFKGSSGSAQCLPPIQMHVNNQLIWLGLVNYLKQMNFEVQGICITGWQRYDHYAVLCELLPVGLPSLAMCLHVLQAGLFTEKLHSQVSKKLGFVDLVNVTPLPRPQEIDDANGFIGHQIYNAMQKFAEVLSRYQAIANSESVLGWFNDFMRSKHNTNPCQVEVILYPLLEIKKSIDILEKVLNSSMEEIYHKNTIEEWFGCFFTPFNKKVIEMINNCKEQLQHKGVNIDIIISDIDNSIIGNGHPHS